MNRAGLADPAPPHRSAGSRSDNLREKEAEKAWEKEQEAKIAWIKAKEMAWRATNMVTKRKELLAKLEALSSMQVQ